MTQAEVQGAADSLRVLLDAVRSGSIEAAPRQHAALAGMVGALDVITACGEPDPA